MSVTTVTTTQCYYSCGPGTPVPLIAPPHSVWSNYQPTRSVSVGHAGPFFFVLFPRHEEVALLRTLLFCFVFLGGGRGAGGGTPLAGPCPALSVLATTFSLARFGFVVAARPPLPLCFSTWLQKSRPRAAVNKNLTSSASTPNNIRTR